MATTISRTWYNTLQDDSGGGTDGTIIDKADFDAILDAIDALLAGNLVFGGSLTIAGALAGATTGAFSSNVTIGGTLGVTGAATLAALSVSGGAITMNAGTNTYRMVGGDASTRFFPTFGSSRTISGMTELGNMVFSDSGFQALAGLDWYANNAVTASADSKLLLYVRDGGVQKGLTIDGSTTVAEITWPGAVVLGSATGGNKGEGALNAKAVYDDNVLLTDWVFDLHYDGTTAHRVPEGGRLYAFEETMASTKADRRLPWMPTRDTFEQERSLGGMISRLWFGQEQQQIYLSEMAARLAVLEEEAA